MTSFLPRMHMHYNSIVCQDIIYTQGIQNIMQLPRLTQCALNSTGTTEDILAICTALQSIGGQKERSTFARKSIAVFQIREKARLGCAINLRRERLYSFLDYFVSIYLPSTTRKRAAHATLKRTCNFGVKHFTFFPELQPHFMTLSNAGGCECEFCITQCHRKNSLSKGIIVPQAAVDRINSETSLLLTAFQLTTNAA